MAADDYNPISSRITFQGRDGPAGRRAGEQQQYDPFDSHGQHASHPKRQRENHQQDERSEDTPRQEYDRGAAGQPLRPYNRDTQLPRNGRNGHLDDRQHSMPQRRERDRSGTQGATRDQGARGDGGAGPTDAPQHVHEQAEDGELAEEIPGPPGDAARPAVRTKPLNTPTFSLLLSLGLGAVCQDMDCAHSKPPGLV